MKKTALSRWAACGSLGTWTLIGTRECHILLYLVNYAHCPGVCISYPVAAGSREVIIFQGADCLHLLPGSSWIQGSDPLPGAEVMVPWKIILEKSLFFFLFFNYTINKCICDPKLFAIQSCAGGWCKMLNAPVVFLFSILKCVTPQ